MPNLTEQELTETFRDSLLNIGHLLPEGMGVSFFRGADDPHTHAEVMWSDGSTTHIVIPGSAPIHRVQAVHAISAAEGKVQG